MEFIGLLLAILIGLSLGIIGAGGSILTVPVLVYFIDLDPVLSTSYSLFIVGATALVGSINYFKNNLISIRTAIAFSLPSIISVLLTRKLILPAIPEKITSIGSLLITKGFLILFVFAILMVLASFSMIHDKRRFRKLGKEALDKSSTNYKSIFLQGLLVGFLTGFVGAGGGFLIIPALVLFARLPMKTAIGTSLLIIAINSLVGFSGDIYRGVQIEWPFILGFSAFAFAGIFIGSYISKFINGQKLKPAFGWFILGMGIIIIIKELFINTQTQ